MKATPPSPSQRRTAPFRQIRGRSRPPNDVLGCRGARPQAEATERSTALDGCHCEFPPLLRVFAALHHHLFEALPSAFISWAGHDTLVRVRLPCEASISHIPILIWPAFLSFLLHCPAVGISSFFSCSALFSFMLSHARLPVIGSATRTFL